MASEREGLIESHDTTPHDDDTPKHFPRHVGFILGNEFCERFSFYGMRTILAMYVRSFGYSEDKATSLTSAFNILAFAPPICSNIYMFPLFGGIIADSVWGKYKTILYLSVVYCIGNIVNAVFSARSLNNGSPAGSFIGLFLIAVGTGGIKPCVSSFGGDQFSHTQEKMLRLFFSIFYFAINAGSVIATFITPELRATSCLGEKTCYPWAFGLPAILMLVALALFCFGSSKYKRVQPSGSVVPTIIGVVSVGARARFAQGLRGGNIHWLDAAKARYDAGTVADVKQFMGVLYMFLPIPIFWALFDQQSSRWVFQAERMDGNLGFMEIKADQMQIFNSVFILILLPVFEKWIYPHMASVKQLHRMALGMLFAALAFIVAGLLEMAIDRTGVDQINIMWQIPQYIIITVGEVLTSPTGNEFAYSQSPPSMKAVSASIWLLNVSAGNFILIFVAETKFFERAGELFFFAALMFAVMLLFLWMARGYKYISSASASAPDIEPSSCDESALLAMPANAGSSS